MAPYSDNDLATYFGFTDLVGFRDFVVYVFSCAPDLFPEDNWRPPNEQMNLERAFEGLRYGLTLLERLELPPTVTRQCHDLVEAAHHEYCAGREHEGQQLLEKVYSILKNS